MIPVLSSRVLPFNDNIEYHAISHPYMVVDDSK